jgi:hypothetical protein
MSLSGNDDAAGSQFWSILGLRPTPASGVNGVGIGEYEGVVRVPRQAFHRFIDGTATPERCVEAYQSSASHGFGIAERKLRNRQLTDDGNVEITGRDLRGVADAGAAQASRR